MGKIMRHYFTLRSRDSKHCHSDCSPYNLLCKHYMVDLAINSYLYTDHSIHNKQKLTFD